MPSSHQRSIHSQAGDLLRFLDYPMEDERGSDEVESAKIDRLLDPRNVAQIVEQATTRSGPCLYAKLLADRIQQTFRFAAGDLGGWAFQGIRWQLTVANMLR